MQYLQTIKFPEFDAMLKTMKKQLEKDKSLLITNDEDKKFFKKTRAARNKFIKEFSAEASAVRKNELGDFDSKVKQIKDLADEDQQWFADSVESYDQKWKNERQDFVRKVINLNLTDEIKDFVTPGKLYEESYLNVTVTENKIKESVAAKATKIKSDYLVAQSVNAQVAELFKQTLDVAEAIELDKQQRAEQERREAVARAEAERQEREHQEALKYQKEREHKAMVEAELKEATENGEVIDAEKMMEINQHATTYANKEALKVAKFTISFEYKESDYPLAWENPQSDLEQRLEGLKNVKVSE